LDVRNTESVEFKIYDLNGTLVKVVQNTNGFIDVSELGNGTYFLKGIDGENQPSGSGKFVILR